MIGPVGSTEPVISLVAFGNGFPCGTPFLHQVWYGRWDRVWDIRRVPRGHDSLMLRCTVYSLRKGLENIRMENFQNLGN